MIFLVLLVAHWIGDFVLQSRWMAENKSKNFWALGLHVVVYTLFLAFFAIFLTTDDLAMHQWPRLAFKFALVNGFLHFIVDTYTSRITSHFWEQKKVHAFFTTIGADQTIHMATLYLTSLWLLGGV